MFTGTKIHLASLLILLLSVESVFGIYAHTNCMEKVLTEETTEKGGTEQEAAFSETIVSSFNRIAAPEKFTPNSKRGNTSSVSQIKSFFFTLPHQRLSRHFLSFICVFRL